MVGLEEATVPAVRALVRVLQGDDLAEAFPQLKLHVPSCVFRT